MEATFQLPLPPTTNRLHRRVGGRVLLSKQAREYQEVACYRGIPTFIGPVSIHAVIVFKTYARCDLDNRWKALLDALVHAGIIEDDNWQIVQKISMEVRDEKPVQGDGMVEVTIKTIIGVEERE